MPSVRPSMYLVSATPPKPLIGFYWNFTPLKYTTCRSAWRNMVAVQNLKGKIIQLILSRKGGGGMYLGYSSRSYKRGSLSWGGQYSSIFLSLHLKSTYVEYTVNSFLFMVYQFSWVSWVAANHKFKCSTKNDHLISVTMFASQAVNLLIEQLVINTEKKMVSLITQCL
jgi:hypothetical protein